EFKGWSLVAGSNNVNFDESRSYEVSALVGELAHGQTLMLYAAWMPTLYTIILDNCNGENKNKVYLYYDEVYYDLTNRIPVKVGYSFSGYYDANNKPWFDGEGVPCTPWDGTVDTLYAYWKPIEYIVQFDKNAYDASGSMDTMTLTYDMPTNLTSNAFSRDKWLFDGWTNTEAHVRYEDGAVVSNLTSEANSAVTLSALWRRDTFALELHNGEDTAYLSVTNGFEYGLLPIPKNSGSAEFAGWWTTNDLDVAKQVSGSDCADKSQTPALYARWKPVVDHETCTVTFSAEGGTPESQTKNLTVGREFGELPTVSYGAGYALLGWYLDGKRVTPETIVPSNITLVARKTLKEFNDAWGCDDIAFETDSGWSIDSSTKVAQSATADKGNGNVELSLEFLTEEDGTLSFDWFAACRPPQSGEVFAYLQFYGGEYKLGSTYIAASTEYATKSDLSIQGGKKYLLKYGRYDKWIYQDGDDCGRVKNFAWKPRSNALGIDEWASFVSITSSFENATFAVGGNALWRTLDDTSVVAVTNLEESGVAWLELSLSGPGELQFDWRVSSEPGFVDTNGVEQICDYLEFLFDGGHVSEVHGLDMFDYTSVVFTNETSGVHTYRWRYAKDDSDKAGEDSAYLKNLSWTPFTPDTTEVEYDDPHGGDKKVVLSVPNSWVDKYNLLSVANTTSYGEALSAYSGKKGSGGADLPYWYDYVAGTDPTNSASLFKIKSVSVVDDTVNIEWDPDWSDPSGDIYREYTIWGKTNLMDEVWHTPTNSASRFFKVEVSLPE
ncbi:MAG: InlB B-repeat-containing protein, partial [Kiritimatiellae bacterium]|nr:InlB B-repeat-containing protein [Kiritimatiellia bacterium]